MRLILTLLLMTFTAPAWAEWVKLGETDAVAQYYDPAKIEKNGNIRRVWALNNPKQRGDYGELSRRFFNEIDCKGKRYRWLRWSVHSEQMAKGEVLRSGKAVGKWRSVVPGSTADALLKIVCAE